ncbi:undecaprenyl-diphosphatase [Tamilnaduibacter salinus]|uniref:Undecaprenyl-diphosphatase n=1 Tax=Tamilnaduibacter salinus TaxID=1484056 RepID=A0A2A2I668_9GAMM|nr:undecaprenyl-diphosphate phosphatase [Tamilnaduibacter salinus]PAV26878.1 undecaprenyl-diphosphatase [Tamilnaduibacter salinus]PVY77471.1 undecaprenyl-diphosphatase [Tamilnaduibacter salinus]
MDAIQALILGLLQGITEFLPISSSAHLILVPVLTGWADQGVAFDLAVHLGTLLAVVLYFRQDVTAVTRDGVLSLIRRETVGQSRLAWGLVIGTIPAGLAGLLLLDLIDTTLRSVAVIATTTLVFGLLLGLADRFGARRRSVDEITLADAFWIGIGQAFALVPGTSRSGVTMTVGLMLGLTREAASRFSFLLAIPIIVLAGAVKLVEAFQSAVTPDWSAFLLGSAVSFLMAITTIHFFLKWLNAVGFWPYVVYRILLAGLLYALIIGGVF